MPDLCYLMPMPMPENPIKIFIEHSQTNTRAHIANIANSLAICQCKYTEIKTERSNSQRQIESSNYPIRENLLFQPQPFCPFFSASLSFSSIPFSFNFNIYIYTNTHI